MISWMGNIFFWAVVTMITAMPGLMVIKAVMFKQERRFGEFATTLLYALLASAVATCAMLAWVALFAGGAVWGWFVISFIVELITFVIWIRQVLAPATFANQVR